MKTIIAGSRDITDEEELVEAFINSGFYTSEVVSGGAKGVDSMAENFSKALKKPLTVFKADWNKYGKKAGPIRNGKMAEYAEALIVVWDGKSRGTKSMIELAKKGQLKIHIHIVEKE